MSASRSRTESTMIGTLVQPRRPRITSTPSMPGRPRSRITSVGVRCARRASSAVLAGRGEVDVVAAGPQVRARARAGSAARRRRRGPGHRRAPRAGRRTVSPPPGVSSSSTAPPIASTNPRATASPSPTPSPAASRRVAGTARTSGRARPRERRGRGRRSGCRRRRRRRRRRRAAGSHQASRPMAFARVGERTLEQAGVGVDAAARPPAHRAPTVGAACAEAGERRGHDLVEADRLRVRARRAPVWSRLMSRRLPTRPSRRSVSSSIVARNSCRSASVQSTSSWSRLVDGRLDRGERRAQVVRDGREQRGRGARSRPPGCRRSKPRPRAPRAGATRRARARTPARIGRSSRAAAPPPSATSTCVESISTAVVAPSGNKGAGPLAASSLQPSSMR